MIRHVDDKQWDVEIGDLDNTHYVIMATSYKIEEIADEILLHFYTIINPGIPVATFRKWKSVKES